jgi:hypothetical protein
MASNFYIFDHFARPLVQMQLDAIPREWVMNDVGRLDFDIATNDPKFTEQNLRFGNLVYLEHIPVAGGGQLPSWVGWLQPDQAWNKGIVQGTAFSAESILIKRPMPWVKLSGSPRQMFLKIIEYAMAASSDILIQPGTVDDVNLVLADDLRTSAYAHIANIIKRSGMTWSITGAIGRNGQLNLYANLTSKSGVETGLVLNNINSELHSPIMKIVGLPTNVVWGHSSASTQRTRYDAVGIHDQAVGDYGFMGENMTFTGVHDPGATLNAAQAAAQNSGRPRIRMNRTALNVGDTFAYLDRGNYVTIDEPDAGFRPDGGIGIVAKARIMTMSYNDQNDRVNLNMEILQ